MEELICPDPEFVWLTESECWSKCIRCKRCAWDHEQANPAQDVRNAINAMWNNQTQQDYPPAMRKL